MKILKIDPSLRNFCGSDLPCLMKKLSVSGTISKDAKKDKKNIYYIIGESVKALKESPFIEKLVSKNIEVLFMIDPMDEYCMQQLKDFEGYKLICVTKEGLQLEDLDDEEHKEFEKLTASYSLLCEVMKETLGEKVEKVVVSERIEGSPGCLVTGKYGWTANMERIMKAQALRDTSLSSYLGSKKTLEINPKNKIVKELKRRVEIDRTDLLVRDITYLLYDLTLIVSGFSVENPTSFSNRVSRLLEIGLNLVTDDSEYLSKDNTIEDLLDTNQATDKGEMDTGYTPNKYNMDEDIPAAD
mmetsp:Transcript_6539/g.10054  ORF Transcript_6539/g.10054 Transcript_6539/m.10054 type:complete len:299 (+) Transcript_6539:1273-2169(+)